MTFFGKSDPKPALLGAAMVALLGTYTASAEQIDAANQELATAGLQGAQLVPGATLEALEEKAGRVDAAEAAVQATTDAVTAAGATSVADLVAQRDKARQEAEAFGNQPGELPTSSTKLKTDVVESAEAPDKEWEAIHERMLAG